MNTNNKKKYRMLKEGEEIQKGDEVSTGYLNWFPVAVTIGERVVKQDVNYFRRPLLNENEDNSI